MCRSVIAWTVTYCLVWQVMVIYLVVNRDIYMHACIVHMLMVRNTEAHCDRLESSSWGSKDHIYFTYVVYIYRYIPKLKRWISPNISNPSEIIQKSWVCLKTWSLKSRTHFDLFFHFINFLSDLEEYQVLVVHSPVMCLYTVQHYRLDVYFAHMQNVSDFFFNAYFSSLEFTMDSFYVQICNSVSWVLWRKWSSEVTSLPCLLEMSSTFMVTI